MKKRFAFLVLIVSAFFLVVSCEPPVEPVDLTGVLKFRTDLTPEQWNEGGCDYYNDQWYSFVTADDTWGSDEDAAPNFAVVSWADEKSEDSTARPQFLRVEKGYGYGRYVWRVYGTDPESGTNNGFAAGDTVTVSIDVWLPDFSAVVKDTNIAWLDILAVGTPTVGSTAGWSYAFDNAVDRLQKYTSDSSGGFTNATGGWITLTKQVVVDSNGVVDVYVKMASQVDNKQYVAYFDNLKVTKP